MAYLAMMAVRLIELHRVLKPTGSLYLHCDPTASHYLKILLDAVFRTRVLRNEIIWKRTSAQVWLLRKFARNHDVILCYTKSDNLIWNHCYTAYDPSYIANFIKISTKMSWAAAIRLSVTCMNPYKNYSPNLTYECSTASFLVGDGQKVLEDATIAFRRDGLIVRPNQAPFLV